MADGSLIAFRYSGEGFVPARVDARPIEDLAAITFLAERARRGAPGRQGMECRLAGPIPFESMPQTTRKYASPAACGANRFTRSAGIQGHGAVGMRFNISDPLQLNRANFVVSYSPSSDLPSEERCTPSRNITGSTGAVVPRYNGADFYDCSGRRRRAARATPYRSGTRTR